MDAKVTCSAPARAAQMWKFATRRIGLAKKPQAPCVVRLLLRGYWALFDGVGDVSGAGNTGAAVAPGAAAGVLGSGG